MTEQTNLRVYIRMALRWWWILLLIPALSAWVSYDRSQKLARVYEATSTVIVGQSIMVIDPTSQDIDTSGRLARTYSLIVRRQPIMQATIDRLDLDESWRGLRSRTQVNQIPSTQLIEITVQDSSPEQASVVADEIARQLILHTPTNKEGQLSETEQFVNDRLFRLKTKIAEQQQEIDFLETTMINAGNPSEKEALRKEITQLEAIISTWENNYSRYLALVETKESSNFVAVIEPAQPRNSPVSPDVRANTLIAGGVGILLALMIVLFLEFIDDTFKSEEDLVQVLKLTPLGTVVRMKGKQARDKLIHSQNPFSIASEAYRIIRTNIQFVSLDHPNTIMMVTSAGQGEGKSVTTANLGVVLAQAGLETIIVDADLRRPHQHQIFKIENEKGLTDLLRSSPDELKNLLVDTKIEHLKVLTSGTLPPNPSELLSSQRMTLVLKRLKSMADAVILDSVPVLPVADSVALSSKVDGVILVVDSTRTRRIEARKAQQKLSQANAKVWGAVLNRVPTRSSIYYMKQYLSKGISNVRRPARARSKPGF